MKNHINSSLENQKHLNSKNSQNKMDINKHFIDLLYTLSPIQTEFRKNITFNNSKRIDRSELTSSKNIYKGNILIESMDNEALKYFETNREEFSGLRECFIFAGAIICVYDSSNIIPKMFKDSFRGSKISRKNFSIIGIDVNKEERTDGVSPDTSLHHEFQHHLNTTLGDKLIVENKELNFKSAQRKNDPPVGYQSKSSFVAFDQKIIEKLFGRSINLQSNHPAIKTSDYEIYENQLHYLDELSASWGQAKSNVFGPKIQFYNNILPGNHNHYELIGNSKEDSEKLKILFGDYLMPGLYLFELKKLIHAEIDKLNSSKNFDNIEKSIIDAKIADFQNKIDMIDSIIFLITQTLGISRTINQALELITIIWEKNVISKLPENYIQYLFAGAKNLKIYL